MHTQKVIYICIPLNCFELHAYIIVICNESTQRKSNEGEGERIEMYRTELYHTRTHM